MHSVGLWIRGIVISYWRWLSLVVVLQLGCGVLTALQPGLYQRLVSLAIGSSDAADLWNTGLSLLAQLAAIYIGIAIFQGLGGYANSVFSFNILRQLQVDFFEQVSHLPLRYFQQKSAGEFFTRFNNDVGQTQKFFADFIPGVLRELITGSAVVVILFYFCSAFLTIVAVGIVLVNALLAKILNSIIGEYAEAQRAMWREINKVFDETVQGIDTLKIQAAEARQGEIFRWQSAALRKLSLKAGTVLAVFSPGIELVSKIGGLGLIALAYFLMSRGSVNLESFLLFFFYAALLQASISQLTRSLSTVQTEFTGVRHLAEFFAETREEEEPRLTSKIAACSVPLMLSDVTFSYPGGRRLYNRAQLEIPANSITVIHGESGVGKSTLVYLLLRFFDIDQGEISIAGTDIRRIPRKELRKKIGVVTQHHFIFQETLRENLLIAKPDATDEEIIRALDRAQMGNFVSRLQAGISTVMDPRGKGISAGERQRISIARLLLRETPIMILDEPWSNIDSSARELLAEVVNQCKVNTTICILTHEHLAALSTDRRYYLDGEKGIFVKEHFFDLRVSRE